MENKDIVVALGVEKGGRVVLQTTEETLPKEVVQQLLDTVIYQVVKTMTPEETQKYLAETKRELIVWKLIALLSFALMVVILLKAKGVL